MKHLSNYAPRESRTHEPASVRFTRLSVGGVSRREAASSLSLGQRIADLPALLARAGFELPEEALPISRFKASYADTLQRVKDGQPQLVTQGRFRFFVMSEEQVLQLLEASQSQATLSHALEDLPSAPEGERPLRASQAPESLGQHRLGA
ncbi:MAG: hypothetical protein ACLGHY_05155 [Gammaproteobacteria bacterium]